MRACVRAGQHDWQVFGAAAAALGAVGGGGAHRHDGALAEGDREGVEVAANGRVAATHRAGVVQISVPRAVVCLAVHRQEFGGEAAHLRGLETDARRRLAVQPVLNEEPIHDQCGTGAPEVMQHAMRGAGGQRVVDDGDRLGADRKPGDAVAEGWPDLRWGAERRRGGREDLARNRK